MSVLTVVTALVMLVGLVGIVVPVLPGLLLVLLATLGWAYVHPQPQDPVHGAAVELGREADPEFEPLVGGCFGHGMPFCPGPRRGHCGRCAAARTQP